MSDPDFRNVKMDVKLATAYVPVNLDSDGTPLSLHAERMIEIEPGRWVDPIVAEIMAYCDLLPRPHA